MCLPIIEWRSEVTSKCLMFFNVGTTLAVLLFVWLRLTVAGNWTLWVSSKNIIDTFPTYQCQPKAQYGLPCVGTIYTQLNSAPMEWKFYSSFATCINICTWSKLAFLLFFTSSSSSLLFQFWYGGLKGWKAGHQSHTCNHGKLYQPPFLLRFQ